MDLCFPEVLGIEEKFWGDGIVALRGQQKLEGGNSPRPGVPGKGGIISNWKRGTWMGCWGGIFGSLKEFWW